MAKEIKFINFVNESAESAVIEIFGTIGGWDWEEWKSKNTIEILSKELNRLKKLDTKEILVKINSYGGDANHGLTIHDALKAHKANITTEITGYCASAATIIFMAGSVRKMSKNALFLIHKCSSWVWGNENELEAELDSQRQTNEAMLNVYEAGCSKSRDEIKTLMNDFNGTGRWLLSDEVTDFGFCTEVFNDNTTAKAAFDKRAFTAFKLPELPEGFTAVEKEDEKLWIAKVFKQLNDYLKTQNQSINNQKKENMQNLFVAFAALAFV